MLESDMISPEEFLQRPNRYFRLEHTDSFVVDTLQKVLAYNFAGDTLFFTFDVDNVSVHDIVRLKESEVTWVAIHILDEKENTLDTLYLNLNNPEVQIYQDPPMGEFNIMMKYHVESIFVPEK